RSMKSDRVAAVRRQQYLLNPHLLVAGALRRQHDTGQQVIRYAGRQELDGVLHRVVEIVALPRPIRLFVALDSNQVSRLVTQENDFCCGDVEIAVSFSDWRRDGGLAFPYQVELSWEGVVVHREVRQRIELNPQLEADLFVLPESQPFDPELAELGLINEQWIHRGLALGAPIALDPGTVVPVPINPQVVTMGGGIHHSLAVALDSAVIVIDPPQHEARSLAVINAVRARWPDKPITHLILTHHHYDHSGGIRAYAAIGAELIVAPGDYNFVTQCLARPHTIRPDTLAATARRPTIRTVTDKCLSLGGGAVDVHRISSPHSAEMLIVYVPSAKLLFNADLFNPGLVPHGAPSPPSWLRFSKDFRRTLEALNLDIEVMVGGHGAPEGRPYQSLIDFTQGDVNDHSYRRDGFGAVTAQVVTRSSLQFMEFCMSAFDAVATEIVPGPNNSVLRATLRIGDTLLVVADESPVMKHTRANLYLYVPNVDEVFERAVKAGAAAVMPITDMPWGDRSGMVFDDFGNSWHIATHLEEVPPEEVARRQAAAPARSIGTSVEDVIRCYFACVNEARWNDYFALFAEDVILDDQMAGHTEGIANVRGVIPLFQSLAALPNFRSELLQVFVDVDEEHAVALWHMRLNAPDGTPVEARGSNLFWVHEGKIRYLRTIHDTAPFQPLFLALKGAFNANPTRTITLAH
ncbi:MAG: MBL fold metallo-hydrolase, partial [Myxococcales bacterium]